MTNYWITGNCGCVNRKNIVYFKIEQRNTHEFVLYAYTTLMVRRVTLSTFTTNTCAVAELQRVTREMNKSIKRVKVTKNI